jgi:hypothetical protein
MNRRMNSRALAQVSGLRTRLGTACAGAVFLVLGGSGGCTGAFPVRTSTQLISVRITDTTTLGSAAVRKPISIERTDTYPIAIEVRKQDGTRDTSFNGYVRVSAKPGTVASIAGPANAIAGRNVKLTAGYIDNLQVGISGSFGDTRIVVDDVGYVPVDPLRKPPPQCADGLDNDGDGAFDFPVDPGCAFANDDSEFSGTFSGSASQPIFYRLPRVADIRNASNGGASTPYKEQQVFVDTGWNTTTQTREFEFIVTRISTSGFYVADLESDRAAADKRGYSGIFAFNFSAPEQMRVCDRLRTLAGTAKEFFGSVQLSFPTWQVEPWNPSERTCNVPEPTWLKATDIYTFPLGPQPKNVGVLLKYVHSLVRVQSGTYTSDELDEGGGPVTYEHRIEPRITRHFGDQNPLENPAGNPPYLITDTASNCDFTRDGKIDFANDREKACAAVCDADPECTEWSNFKARSQFQIVVQDNFKLPGGRKEDEQVRLAKILSNGSTAQGFNAAPLRGQPIRAFSGTLGYFSGGTQFTIEARCIDDIVVDPAATVKTSNETCIFPRTGKEAEQQ